MRKLRIVRAWDEFQKLDSHDKKLAAKTFLINNSLYIFMVFAIIYIQIKNPLFLSLPSIVNIVILSAANIPIALGIAGTIVLTGTDLSAGRVVGITAVIAASISQPLDYANKMFPGLPPAIIPLILLLVVIAGAGVGAVNGFSVAKFKLHPFIVTLATQLIVYGAILMYLNLGNGNGQAISGTGDYYRNFIKGELFRIGETPVPRLVLYAILLTILMWFVWNKTTFGKNMFAVGSNPEAAEVSGVNVDLTIMMVFILAGIMYAYTGFVEAVRIGSNSAATGLNYELDAIAACVIGGVSFVGGIGRISGVIMGVVLLRLIFVGLNALGIDSNLQYIIKGLIILIACAVDMRKYLVKK